VKPPPFKYARPESLDEVLGILSEYGDEARVLAGGQSLIPLLNFRLARPAVLVDIVLVTELRRLVVERGMLRVGAAVTQNAVERSSEVARFCPLLKKALPFVGHLQNRMRGTVAGSIAHADPAAELPGVVLALGGRVHVTGPAGNRTIEAEELFQGFLSTSIADGEILTAVEVQASGPRTVRSTR